jgi:hypothetical protein
MNEQDLRDCFAMFAMNGLLSNGLTDYSVANVAYKMADQMLEARKAKPEEEGILAIKPTKKTVRKG